MRAAATSAWALLTLASCSTGRPTSDAAVAVERRPEPGPAPLLAPVAPPDDCGGAPPPLAIPIAVENDRGPRYPPLVRFPIPLPRAPGLRSLASVAVATPGGEVLPAQLSTLARYGSHPGDCAAPIRWAYAWVPVGVDAPRSHLAALTFAPGVARAAPSLTIAEQGGRIVVDTGELTATIDARAFAGIALSTRAGYAGVLTATLEAGGARRFALEGAAIEEAGPYVAGIRLSGRYRGAEGPGAPAVLRARFYAGTAVVELDHTVYHGETEGGGAEQAKNRWTIERASLSLPLAAETLVVSGDAPATLASGAPVRLAQHKRTPTAPRVRHSIRAGDRTIAEGGLAAAPFLAARGSGGAVLGVLAHFAVREPAAIVAGGGVFALEPIAEPITVGGARGIWSRGAIDLAPPEDAGALAERARQLRDHLERPLIGVPSAAAQNAAGTEPRLPERGLEGALAKLDEDLDRLHQGSVEYLRRFAITGLQLWPDLPKSSCLVDGNCPGDDALFDGGEANYWDWARVELEEFLRTGHPPFAFDFAIGEAITFAETISFRPAPEVEPKITFAGMAPCFGSSRGYGPTPNEGLNHRITCNSQHSYNKVLRKAYVLTADRRFLDVFAQGAASVGRRFGDAPARKTEPYRELAPHRGTYQALEILLDQAEFGRDPAAQAIALGRARTYLHHMLETSLERGHVCNLGATGFSDPKLAGRCDTDQAWMLAPFVEWVHRYAELADDDRARRWLFDFAKTSMRHNLVLDERGRPDVGAIDAVSSDDRRNGWRTVYRCLADASRIRDETCKKATDLEANGGFYSPGLMALLAAYGVVLGSDESDPLGLCAWLPEATAVALRRLDPPALNGMVWGKSSGQAYGHVHGLVGAIERCR